jgi:hypothetical protein
MSEPSPDYSPTRRETRMTLMLPVVVRAHAPDGTALEEEALMQDVCGGGMAFRTTVPLRRGQVVHLTAPVPRSFRKHGVNEPSYAAYAIVRNLLVDDEGCRVGVMFFGEEPPSNYRTNPAARYVLPSDVVPGWSTPIAVSEGGPEPGELRRHPRFAIFVDLALEQVDEWGAVIDGERTVADNVSLGGARVFTSHAFNKGDVLIVREIGGSFEARALVVGSFAGPDRMRRLNLHFLDGREPRHLVPGH